MAYKKARQRAPDNILAHVGLMACVRRGSDRRGKREEKTAVHESFDVRAIWGLGAFSHVLTYLVKKLWNEISAIWPFNFVPPDYLFFRTQPAYVPVLTG